MIHTMMITFVQLAAGLAKVCGMGLLAINAKELVAIQNSTGMTIMSKQIDALKLAFEALKKNQHLVADNERHAYVMEYNSIIEKCEEALAQPEQTNTRPYYTIDELNAWADEKEKQAWRNAAIRVGKELSSVGPDGYYDMNAWQWLDWAMKNIKKAQPEQEPVAWSYWQSCLNDDGTQTAPWVHRLSKFKPTESIINKDVTPLYTTPPQPKEPEQEPMALQDDEIYDAAFSAYCRGENSRELFRIMWSNRIACSIGWDRDELKSFARNIAALYTAPPQRTWVGLTDEDRAEILNRKWWNFEDEFDVDGFLRLAEAKLKELNT